MTAGQIFGGDSLSEVLAARADTFTDIRSIPAELELQGVEPQLSTVTRSLLFSIAHNALPNAFRHSDAGERHEFSRFRGGCAADVGV